VSADDPSSLHGALNAFTPQVVINCIGVVKQLEQAADPLIAIPINSLLPHQLAAAARAHGARLVHVSTDCVFSGRKGQYSESDAPDAEDLYGRSKLLGEVTGAGCLTLRTSIIGPEPSGRATGLLDWFLRQTGSVRGFRRAIFSGLPTVALAELIRDFVLPNDTLEGLYHVGAEPIDKFGLLQLIRERWGKSVEIEPCDLPEIDRSLDCSVFRARTGFVPAPWPDLVASMYRFG
jgi:dTDP-4-dehydrorhamnose reductase